MSWPFSTAFNTGQSWRPEEARQTMRGHKDSGFWELPLGESISSLSKPVPIFFDRNDSGRIKVADAADIQNADVAGFVLLGQTGVLGDTLTVATGLGQVIRGFSGLTQGVTYYLSDIF